MNKYSSVEDVITLTGPLVEEYTTVIRLTASGIAAQMGYTYQEIEDIKKTITEILDKGISQTGGDDWIFSIKYLINESHLKVDIGLFNKKVLTTSNSNDDSQKSFVLQSAKVLMDKVSIKHQKGQVKVVFQKFLYGSKEEQDGKETTVG